MLTVDIDIVRLSTYDADGFLGIGIGGVSAKTELAVCETHHPFGFAARPHDPEVDDEGEPVAACSVLRLEEGSTDTVIALGDPRATPLLPALPKGSTLHYAWRGPTKPSDIPRVLLSGADGSVVVHVPSSPAEGQTLRLEHGETGPAVVLDATAVHLGAATGTFPVMIATPDLIAFFAALSAATGAPLPTLYQATKAKAI